MIETIATLNLIKPTEKLVNILFSPLIKKLKNKATGKIEVFWEKVLKSYPEQLRNSYEHYSYFNSVVFLNEQKKLHEFYLPLTLACPSSGLKHKIDKYPINLIEEKGKILIIDSAGMGKTTLLKFMFLDCIESCSSIPVFIELRKVTNRYNLIDLISDKLSGLDGKRNSELLFELLSSGSFVIFLDGYDEISSPMRNAVTTDINKLVEKAPNNKFIISSREEYELSSFTQFKRYNIHPITKKEAYLIIDKYSENKGSTLIEYLENPDNNQIHEFLTNPLLISLLYKSFEYKPIIPNKKHIFYHQVFEALFETHDLRKEGGSYIREKKSKLGIDRFDLILRYLASSTYKNNKFEYTHNDLIEHINSAKKNSNEKTADASSILHDLTHAVPLMIYEGEMIRWSHRSIQEYFCASYICRDAKQNQEKIFKELIDGNLVSHTNLISICAEIDPVGFEYNFTRSIAKLLISNFNALDSSKIINIPEKEIIRRKELYTYHKMRYLFSKEANLFEINSDEKNMQININIHNEMSCLDAHQYGYSGDGPEYIVKVRDGFSLFIDSCWERLDFCFIKKSKLSHIPIKQVFDFGEKIVSLDIDLNHDNKINNLDNFEKISDLIENDIGHIFNYETATVFVHDLELKVKEKEEHGGW